MKSILKRSLLALAAAFVAVANTGNLHAQIPTSANVGEVNAIIDLSTGEIILQIGAGLQVFEISTDFPGFFSNAAAAAPALAIIDPLLPPGPPSPGPPPGPQFSVFSIGAVNPFFFPVGEFSLGNVLSAGLTEDDFAATGFTLRFVGPGNPDPENAVSAPDNVFIVSGVPEPGSLSLLALAGLGVVARRRR